LKAIIGWSNVLITRLLEKNPTTRSVSSPALRKPCGTLVAAGRPRHALDFQTWRSLVRQQGLDDEQAVELMVKMVRCAIRG